MSAPADPPLGNARPLDGYVIPGMRVFPEGLAYDPATGALFTTSMEQGAAFRTTLDRREFEVMSPAGANGCTAALGVHLDVGRRCLFVSAGVTGMAYVLDADTGALLGRYTDGLAPEKRGTMGPNATSPTLINDVAVVGGDACFTNSYRPIPFKLPGTRVDATARGGEGQLEPWLLLEGTMLPLHQRREPRLGLEPGRHRGDSGRPVPDRRPDERQQVVPHRDRHARTDRNQGFGRGGGRRHAAPG